MRCIALGLLTMTLGLSAVRSEAVQPGQTAPDFTIPTVQGEPDFTLSAHANEVVVVALFRTD